MFRLVLFVILGEAKNPFFLPFADVLGSFRRARRSDFLISKKVTKVPPDTKVSGPSFVTSAAIVCCPVRRELLADLPLRLIAHLALRASLRSVALETLAAARVPRSLRGFASMCAYPPRASVGYMETASPCAARRLA